MKMLYSLALVAALAASQAHAACTYPKAPEKIPDGGSATLEEMLASQKEVKAFDLAITGYVDYARAGFHDQKVFDRVYGAEPSIDQLEMWDICREMSFRIAWKPYMYSQTLPHLLGAVRAPALVVWGDDDRVVPQSAAARYVEALPNARLEIVKASGHCVDMEQPEALAKLIVDFIGRE